MDYISEDIIDGIVRRYKNNLNLLVSRTAEYMESHPTLLAYLDQESNDVLLEEERDLQWYILVVCLSAIDDTEQLVDAFDVEALSTAEESNWEVLESSGGGSWRDRLDPFFKDSPQEDLIAFIEDMVQTDEDSPITNVGREVIFITVKSVVDCAM